MYENLELVVGIELLNERYERSVLALTLLQSMYSDCFVFKKWVEFGKDISKFGTAVCELRMTRNLNTLAPLKKERVLKFICGSFFQLTNEDAKLADIMIFEVVVPKKSSTELGRILANLKKDTKVLLFPQFQPFADGIQTKNTKDDSILISVNNQKTQLNPIQGFSNDFHEYPVTWQRPNDQPFGISRGFRLFTTHPFS